MNNEVSENTTKKIRAIRVHNIKDVKRLMQRLIYEVQKDEIEEKKARLLSYLCKSYVEIVNSSELEAKVNKIMESK